MKETTNMNKGERDYLMIRQERFRLAVLKRFPRVNDFCKHFHNNVGRPGWSLQLCNNKTVLTFLWMCKDLKLDPFDLLPLESFHENRKENILENRILGKYCELNREGRERFFDMLDDLWSIEKYRRA